MSPIRHEDRTDFPTHIVKSQHIDKWYIKITSSFKSHQLRWKDRLTGTGWKKKRKNRNSHCSKKVLSHKKRSHVLYYSSSSNPKPFLSTDSSFTSWKFKKKESAQSSPLKENTSWKRRKKKQPLTASLDLSYLWKGPSLWRCPAWKRRKKKRRCSKRFFDEFDWDPGTALKVSPDKFFIISSFQC